MPPYSNILQLSNENVTVIGYYEHNCGAQLSCISLKFYFYRISRIEINFTLETLNFLKMRLISRVFLQRQLWIINYYVKKFVRKSQ